MHFLLAIDSFKSCLTSTEAEQTVTDAIHNCQPEATITVMPVSDGGDGMIEAFAPIMGCATVNVNVHDALMRPIVASYAVTSDGTAVIETSRAIGLSLLHTDEMMPIRATSYGAGELVCDAFNYGCRKFIIGLGGSATSDCGIGFLRALIDTFTPGLTIDDVMKRYLHNCTFIIASDVTNPLYGNVGAAAVFATQKGATDQDIQWLDNRAKRFSYYSARHCGYDRSEVAGAGAAGGLGYAFIQYLNADVISGAELLFRYADFNKLVQISDVVITGEGSSDTSTFMGKLPIRILKASKMQNKPVWLISGRVENRDAFIQAGFDKVEAVSPLYISQTDAINPTIAKKYLKQTVEKLLKV